MGRGPTVWECFWNAKQRNVEAVRCWSCEVHQRMRKCCWDANERTWKNPCTTDWMNQWTNEPVNQWANESRNQWTDKRTKWKEAMNRWINRSIKQSINQARIQRVNEATKQWTTDSINEWCSESMNQRINESVKQLIKEPTNQWINESANHWIKKSKDEWLNESTNQWINQPINQWISESMHQSMKSVFEHFEMQVELSLQSCALFVDNFPRSRRETAEIKTLLRRPEEPHYPKKTQVFALESVFTRKFTRFRTVTLPNYLMMGGWHDDVVDMVVGMLTITIVRNLEVF